MFHTTGLDPDDLAIIVTYKETFVKYLHDIQNHYRITRAMNKDPEDRLLIGSEVIDEIINNISKVEEARIDYLEFLKE